VSINDDLDSAIQALSQWPGIRGCALVEASSGMVLTAHGELARHVSLWEAASDHWRLQSRHAAHFDPLNRFVAVALYHTEGLVALFRCTADAELLFVAVGRHRAVDWSTLQRLARQVGTLVAEHR